MIRRLIVISCCILFFLPLSAQNRTKKKAAASWEEAVVNLKRELREGKQNGPVPVFSDVMRHKMPARLISMDVTGVDDLLLATWGTADGDDWDHAVWANARLITTDGKEVWLDDLKWKYAKAPYGCPILNKHFSGRKITVGGKVYDHGILLHADGEVVYSLGKKYKKFEAEIGIDDGGTSVSSVIFRVQDASGKSLADRIDPKFREQVKQFALQSRTSVDLLLASPGSSIEKNILMAMIQDFPDKAYFTHKVNELESKKIDEQIYGLLQLAQLAQRTKKLEAGLKWVNLKAMRMAFDDMKKNPAFQGAKYEGTLKEIETAYPTVAKNLYRGDTVVLRQGERILAAQKELLLANPLLDMDKIVVTSFRLGENARVSMAPALGMPSNNWSSMYSAARVNRDAEIVELSNLRGDIQKRTIYKPERKVNIADLQMHWDGDKLLFSSIDENNHWQVYEVGVDGKNFHQKVKVDEPDLEFCDANYLPDGRIIASTNIGYHGVPCVNGSDAVGNLALYDPKNGSFRRLTFDQDGNWNPVVMNNGRVMYTRWEYTDLTHYFSRIVMHMNPDGTENKALYGSGSFWPNSTFDIKPLPGSTTRFVGVISGHHGIARSGRLMIFDPAKSRKEEQGVVQEMPFRDRKIIPEVKDQLVDGVWPQFMRPYPLNDNYYLVSAKLSPGSLWGIYLVDVFDNLTCIAEFEGEGLNMPLPLVKHPTPPVIPDRVNLADKEATVFIQDIYEGEGTKGLPKGLVKELRIFAYEYAYRNSPSDHDAQGIQSGWDIKRLLGTVPVEEDGSAIFKVPANTPISIQPLDKEGRALQWFRSWFTPMPGETVSCVGCHEDQNQIPIPKRTIASQIKPHQLQTPEGGVRSFTYELEVQPILDRTCVACHNENSKIDLRGGQMDTKYPRFGRQWSKSYLAIMPYVYRQGPEAEMYVLKPYEYHATNSELVRLLSKGHHGVELTDKEWRTLYNWIDFNAPYHGAFTNISKIGNFNQYDRRMELMQKYNDIHVDWRKEIADYAAYLGSKGKIEPVMPEKNTTPKYKEVKASHWPFDTKTAREMQESDKKAPKTVEVAPGISMKFVWVPAGQFVMGDNRAEKDCAPAFKAAVKKGFWMAECEVTNEQFCSLFPEHNSRIIGQFWKDHTTAGLPANKPQQPVIRVSCEEAMDFCKKLGQKTGLKMNLPTEMQWEWACRGGSDEAFWYGKEGTDFGKFENMADAQLSDMAVIGVDPKPMSKNSSLRPYWDYLPKDSSVDDGEMLTAFVGKYQANPWGLKDMHGNVAEWTCSDYVPYPLKKAETSDRKVVRGGSWTDRPKYSASYTRKAFYPWQKVYNVGFRVIIEED